MTTMDQSERTCSVCCKKSKQTAIMSTNQFGSPDLDLRPPEMMRSTMAYWVEECPHCHFAYPSIETKVKGVEALLNELAQMETSWASRTQGLIRRFMTASHIAEFSGQKMEAAEYALNAAWDADDSHDDVSARECRMKPTFWPTSTCLDEISASGVTEISVLAGRAQVFAGALGATPC